MGLNFRRALGALFVAALVVFARPVVAHEHNEIAEAAEASNAADAHAPDAMDHMAGHHADEARPTTIAGRTLAWIGHMHPVAVHFPVALIPISWLALILARRRGYATDIVRALIVFAGAAAVIAALLGWIDAGAALADRDPVQTAHRWTGTALALLGALLALWAWRRPQSVNGGKMVWALGLATLIVFVQGGLGAVLTHGMEHLRF